MSQNLPKRSPRDFLSLRHPNDFVLHSSLPTDYQVWPIESKYIEDITRWREDMNFMFEWQEQYLTRSLRLLVRYCSCHENITDSFIIYILRNTNQKAMSYKFSYANWF